MNKLLDIRNLSKHYDQFRLENISMSVLAGSVVGLIGQNGAGKTTLIKAALGLIRPHEGEVTLLGTPISGTNGAAFAKVKQRVGVVFDACSFPAHISVADAGSIMKHAYSGWDAPLFKRYLDAFRLDPKKEIKNLSRGMGMKLSLACVFSHHPDLLILDEATAGLDPLARNELLGILREFMTEADHGILMSSHITSDLERLADYIICIDDGRMVFSETTETICDMAGIAQCRSADFERIAESDFFALGELRSVKHAYGISVLAPDRFAFAAQFPDIVIERASIDEYMGFMLKGETR